MEYLVALVFMGILVFIYIGSYLLNKKVTPPIDIDVEAGCNVCRSVGCPNNPAHHKGVK